MTLGRTFGTSEAVQACLVSGSTLEGLKLCVGRNSLEYGSSLGGILRNGKGKESTRGVWAEGVSTARDQTSLLSDDHVISHGWAPLCVHCYQLPP